MKSRKLERKNARKEKKQKRNEFFVNKNKNKSNEEIVEKTTKLPETQTKRKVKKINELKRNNERNIKPKLSFKQKKDIEREEKEIKRLEKLLKLNRRKRKGKKVTTIPKSFQIDGLDYILDVVDSQKLSQISDNEDNVPEDNHSNSGSDFSSDNQDMSGDEEDNLLEEEGEQNDEQNVEESDFESDSNNSDIEMDENQEENNELKEDIYGFIRDKSGNIISKPKSDSKENIIKESGSGFSQQLLRRIRGSMNRLTINNIMIICGQMKEMFDQNSRYSVNECLFNSINGSLIDLEYISAPKMKTESALLLSILHHMIGDEVGGHAIHSCICKFNDFIKDNNLNESKKIDNLVIFILNLYVCGLIESLLIYEIITKLCDNFTEKSIELINLILKSVGFVLRKDNAIKMKELIERIQNEAKNVDKSNLSGNRITFLLDSLIAIKNNNTTKLKGYGTEIDVQLIETTLRSSIKKSRVNSISGSFEAILQSSHWYSYTQNIETIISNEKQTNESKSETSVEHQINDQLFKALRLNTPLRKTIVMALSSCNDYIDAANRLISIGKKQFSEVINVLIHVAIHEKQFNPFYCHLFNHLSQCDRKYKVSLDFAIRDKITDLCSLDKKESHILAQLILHLLKLNTLSITCLKVVHFTDMNETYVQFIKRILIPILNEEQLIEQILSKIAIKDSFATAIRLFINCFIDPKDKNKLDVKRFTTKRIL